MTSVPVRLAEQPSLSIPESLGENEAAVLDTFVAPVYLDLFWQTVRPLLLVGEAARLAHLGCLTGYPDGELLQSMPNTTAVGVDPSEACLALARTKPEALGFDYVRANPAATGLPEGTFSHVLVLHAPATREERLALYAEAARLLYPGGQLLVGLPGGQSFAEIVDLLAEYALKFDVAELLEAVETLAVHRLGVEAATEELEEAGFVDIDFAASDETLGFDSGRALLEDPSARFFIVPTLLDWLGVDDLGEAMTYVAKAVDKYWSDERLDLGLKVLALSARR